MKVAGNPPRKTVENLTLHWLCRLSRQEKVACTEIPSAQRLAAGPVQAQFDQFPKFATRANLGTHRATELGSCTGSMHRARQKKTTPQLRFKTNTHVHHVSSPQGGEDILQRLWWRPSTGEFPAVDRLGSVTAERRPKGGISLMLYWATVQCAEL